MEVVIGRLTPPTQNKEYFEAFRREEIKLINALSKKWAEEVTAGTSGCEQYTWPWCPRQMSTYIV